MLTWGEGKKLENLGWTPCAEEAPLEAALHSGLDDSHFGDCAVEAVMKDREAIYFTPNESVAVSLEDASPRENSMHNWTYFLCGGKIMHVPKVCSVKIGTLDPAAGEEFYITRKVSHQGRRQVTEWLVSPDPTSFAQRPVENGQPGDTRAAAAATGIAETQLERQLRESREVRERAAQNIRAKIALEQKEPVIVPPADREPLPERKPVQTAGEATAPPPPPVAPEPPKQPERYVWFPNLVEVARSYTFKLNVGNYESRDFFCSQKAECRPEDADLVSEKLYEFCKRQVMKAVESERAIGKQRQRA